VGSEHNRTARDAEGRDDRDFERIHDYAWDWFSYHAGQRTSMFNYALASSALLAAGYAAVLDKHAIVAAAIGFVGAFVLFCFVLVDRRNASLVDRGEDVLDAIERTLFAAPRGGSRLRTSDLPEGIHLVDKQKYPDGSLVRDFCSGKHRVHLRLVESVLAAVFLLGGTFALVAPAPRDPDVAAAIGNLAKSVDATGRMLERLGDKLDALN
jgi:hypothetical protein